MKETLVQRDYDFINETVLLPTDLEKFLDSGFRTEKDCILLKELEYFGKDINSDFEKTEYEDFSNHIHIDNYMDVTDEFEYLKVGLEFAKRIYIKLNNNFGSNFRIIISFSETTYENQEIDTYSSCVVRFYMIRPDCDNKFKIDNLEEFKLDRVLVIE